MDGITQSILFYLIQESCKTYTLFPAIVFSPIVDACPELLEFVDLSFDTGLITVSIRPVVSCNGDDITDPSKRLGCVKLETSSEAVKGKVMRAVGGIVDDKPSLSKIYGTCIFKNIDP